MVVPLGTTFVVIEDPMSRTVVFLSYRAEIPWAARVARRLRADGVDSHLWIFGRVEHALGVATGAFVEVVDLTAGFDRQRIDGTVGAAARAAALQIELSLGETFLHTDAASDRRITGVDHVEIPRADIRHRWTWDQLCGLVVHLEGVVTELLDRVGVDAVMVEPALMPERFICRLVRRSGVRLLIPSYLAYLDDRLYFSDRLDAQWPACIQRYDDPAGFPASPGALTSSEAIIASIRDRATIAQRREDVRDFLTSRRMRFGPSRITNVWRQWSEARRDNLAGDPHAPYPELVTPWARGRRKLERFRLRRGFERWASRSLPTGPYVAYFLHAQPEITVDSWAFEFQDQVALIRNIVATIPADTVVAVKEHWIQAGLRDPAFYEELLSIPGVVLLHDVVPTREVIRGAQLVCTLTGTAAVEAMVVGVPSVIFGDIYYEHFRGIQRVRTVAELASVVADLRAFPLATDEDVMRAFAARYDASHEAGWMSGGRVDADEDKAAVAILREIDPQGSGSGSLATTA